MDLDNDPSRHLAARYFFVDEAGNFDFSAKPSASKYFILTSVCMEDCQPANDLLALRRQLVWEGNQLNEAFHATSDKQRVRDRVFDTIASMNLRVDATIFEKRKTLPRLTAMKTFYKHAWFYHAKHIVPLAFSGKDDLMVVAASIGTKGEQAAIGSAIRDVVKQCGREDSKTRIAYWPASSDPCLQVADYCCWAIQRKWERADTRSYDLISRFISTEYEIFHSGTTTYY